jgi:hypothetical protein
VRLAREVGSVYARIGRTYLSWSPALMTLAVLVFLPLGLIDALHTTAAFDRVDVETFVGLAALIGLVGALVATSLVGEVFYSGAIAIALTHPEDEQEPSLGEIAREIRYGRLVAVDLIYVLIVAVGLLLFVVPGVLAFVWLGLAGPVIEIEKRGVRGALRRSFDLVRGHFWLVFWVFAPIEIAGDALGEWIGHLVHGLLGEGFLGTWLGESGASIVLSPFFAIAAVLLTVDLIGARDGSAPRVKSKPFRSRSKVKA